MSDAHVDDQVAQVIVGLIRVRRALDPLTFDNLLGSVLAEIQIGLDVAEEQALEEFHTRPIGPNVVRFPGLRPERNGQP
ncbi:hypothetical protein [Methylobacterium sp. 22177]|uniref:hypothetical protein n=1 Tax=Methylobacterium sp. 22177 TaxID=3453885 RepID=UPI003F8445E6